MNEVDQRAALLRVLVDEPGPVVPSAATWSQWTWLARRERVVPLLYRLVDTVPSDLDDDQRLEIRRLHGSALARCVQLEHHLVRVGALLEADGIRVAVLKGAATAHLDYPDPSWRELGDVDLLVDPACRASVASVVERQGWAQAYALHAGHGELTHAVTFGRDGMELDVHQRIGHRALGLRVPTGDLLDRRVPLAIAGVPLFALDPVDRLVHAAIHAVSSRGVYRKLSSVADVLLLAARRPELATRALTRAEGWRVRPVVERAVLDAHAAAALDLHPAWANAVRRPTARRDRLVEWAYLGASRRPVAEEVAYLRLLGGWRERWRYLRGYFVLDAGDSAPRDRSGVLARIRYVADKLRSRPT